jgi:hypothetical protein
VAHVHLFGIRHHGPGSARSLKNALEQVRPDVVLIEGPPDANDLIELAKHPQLKPPVALLVYLPQAPSAAVMYPFAEYSPEWQALQYGLKHSLPVRFIDLPQSARLREPSENSAESEEASETEQTSAAPAVVFGEDPLAPMARAAGYTDAERWWDHLVESRAGHDIEVFKAIHEMVSAVRADIAEPLPIEEAQREAHMRKCLRAAIAEGHENIAVVCGAWHTPALAELPSTKADDALLKGLPRAKTAAAWTPWSYERLSFRSGYGAGVDSPVWYELLWNTRDALGAQWLTRAARLLREHDIPVSSAHVIEAVRLAEALASLRGRPVPGLAEFNDAAESVLSSGNAMHLKLIARRWHYGDRLGSVPEDFPAAPLQQDLTAQQKRLRLPPKLEIKTLDLDLREPLDRERSQLLRRLRLLAVPWGEPKTQTSGRGTFHELWDIGWRPEFAITVIEGSRFGHTVEQAATAAIAERSASPAATLSSLIGALEDALFANLPGAIGSLVAAIEARAAVSTDVLQLLEALPPLVNVYRYGNVRATDVTLVGEILRGLIPRIFVAGPSATTHIDDEAAKALWQHLMAADRSLAQLSDEEYSRGWREMLKRIAENESAHALLAGYAWRLLYDAGEVEFDALSDAFSRALSVGTEPAVGAHWVEGLLSTSGAVLIHDDRLRNLVDRWVRETSEEHFVQVLPLVRRTFANFPAPERRHIGERLRTGGARGSVATGAAEFDLAAAQAVLPVLQRIWNLPE